MKNIYIFDEYISSQKNGIGTYLQELLYCFKSSGHNICLIIFNADTEEFNIVEEKGTKRLLFPVIKGHFLHHVQVIDKFLRLYIQDNPNNVFFLNHSPCGGLMESLKKIFPLSKIVFTIHDFGWTGLLFGDFKAYKKVIKEYDEKTGVAPEFKVYQQEKRTYELSDKIICLSVDTYNILKSIYKMPEVKVSLIPNGLRLRRKTKFLNKDEETKIRIQKNINVDDKVLLFIGRPTAQKGAFALIYAMKSVIKEFPNVKLAVIGDGNEVSMRKIINDSSEFAASIIITGQLNREEVEKWLTIADIGIISSYYEQCSYTAIEMMMHGLPIVASDGLGIRNMFSDLVNARITKIGNRKNVKIYQTNLANYIIHLLKSPSLCHNLSEAAQKTYKTKYTIKKMRANYKKLIDSL